MKELEERILKEVKLHGYLMTKIPNKYENSEKKRHLKALNKIAEDFAYKTCNAYSEMIINKKLTTIEDVRYYKAIESIINYEELFKEVKEQKDLKYEFKQQGVELERSR